MSAAAVELERVTLTYATFGSRVAAVRDIDLVLPEGSWTLVSGDNGAGKSTLLRVVAGEVEPDYGVVRLFGKDLRRLSSRRRASLVAYVRQRADESLALGLTIAEHVVACGLTRRRFVIELEALTIEGAFPFLEEAWARPVETLSGGERQVLGIVLQLIRGAPLLLLDEALSALDPGREAHVLAAVDIAARRATVIQVTHQPERLRLHASAEIRMRQGQIANREAHPYG